MSRVFGSDVFTGKTQSISVVLMKLSLFSTNWAEHAAVVLLRLSLHSLNIFTDTVIK